MKARLAVQVSILNHHVSFSKPLVGRRSAPRRDPSRLTEPFGGRRAGTPVTARGATTRCALHTTVTRPHLASRRVSSHPCDTLQDFCTGTDPTSLSAYSPAKQWARTVPGAASPLAFPAEVKRLFSFDYCLRPDVLPWTCALNPGLPRPAFLPPTCHRPFEAGRDTRTYRPEFDSARESAPRAIPARYCDHCVGFSRSWRIFSTRSRRRASSCSRSDLPIRAVPQFEVVACADQCHFLTDSGTLERLVRKQHTSLLVPLDSTRQAEHESVEGERVFARRQFTGVAGDELLVVPFGIEPQAVRRAR